MSTSYSFSLAVGFLVTEGEIDELFRKQTRPEKFHMEDRFDSKTGKRTGEVKVVDEDASSELVIDGKVVEDDPETVMRALCALISDVEVQYTWHSRLNNDEPAFVVGPPMPPQVTENLDGYPVSCSGGVDFDAAVALGPQLKKVEEGLKKMGFDPGKAVVLPAWCIG
jgi:hypothetical protein